MNASVATLVARLESNLDAITDEIVQGYLDRISSYRDAAPEVLADARAGARASIVVGAAIMRDEISGASLTGALFELGQRRARQGIPLHDVLLAYLIGSQIFWNRVFEYAPDDQRERLEIISTLTRASFDLLQHAVAAVSEGYLEVESARVADIEHEIHAVVETLAGLREETPRHQTRAEDHGIRIGELRWCVVAAVAREDAAAAARNLRMGFPGAAVGRIGSSVVGFFPGDAPPKVDLEPAGRSAIAGDSARAYLRAKAALAVASRSGKAGASYEDVAPLAMLLAAPEEERAAFVQAQLGAVLRDGIGEDLVASLEAYYAHGQSIAAAARALFVHRHTLEYRLQRVEALTGADIKEPSARLLLEMALYLRRLDAAGA